MRASGWSRFEAFLSGLSKLRSIRSNVRIGDKPTRSQTNRQTFGLTDETLRLHEYSPGFEPKRFAAHEKFFVEDVRRWTESRFGLTFPTVRTAVFGVSAGGELALALGLRHPHVYGAIFCASPGGGYKPPGVMPSPLPRTYLVAGTQEPFFLENAKRWADALRDASADVVLNERVGSHGGAFWREEFPLMVAWAFAR